MFEKIAGKQRINPEISSKEHQIELEKKVKDLSRYFFNDFNAKLSVVLFYSSIFAEKKEKREEFRDKIKKSLLWMEHKYSQIPFKELKDKKDYEPLFKVNERLKELRAKSDLLLNEQIKEDKRDELVEETEKICLEIQKSGKEYLNRLEQYYRKLNKDKKESGDKIFSMLPVEKRALLEFPNREKILQQAVWLKNHEIEPNSFEKAAMEFYGIDFGGLDNVNFKKNREDAY